MNDVVFIILGIFIQNHLYYGQDLDLPTRARILYRLIYGNRPNSGPTQLIKFDINQKAWHADWFKKRHNKTTLALTTINNNNNNNTQQL